MFHVPEYALNLGRLLLRAGFRILFYWPGLVLATLVLLYLLMSPGNEGTMTLDHGTFYGTLLALWQNLVFFGFSAEVATVCYRSRPE